MFPVLYMSWKINVSVTHHSWQYKISWLFLYICSQSTILECSPSLWRRWWATTRCKSYTSPSPRASGGRGSGDTPPSPALLALSSGLGSCQILSMYNKYCSSLLQVIYIGNSMSIGRKERSPTKGMHFAPMFLSWSPSTWIPSSWSHLLYAFCKHWQDRYLCRTIAKYDKLSKIVLVPPSSIPVLDAMYKQMFTNWGITSVT